MGGIGLLSAVAALAVQLFGGIYSLYRSAGLPRCRSRVFGRVLEQRKRRNAAARASTLSNS